MSLSQVQGSGPNGCIVAADVAGYQGPVGAPGVAAAVGGALPAGDYRDVPVSQIRRVIARRLLESKQTIPHYYLTVDVSLDKLTAVRKQLNDQLASRGTKLSVNDFVVKAAALALREVPEMNASWQTEFIRQYTVSCVRAGSRRVCAAGGHGGHLCCSGGFACLARRLRERVTRHIVFSIVCAECGRDSGRADGLRSHGARRQGGAQQGAHGYLRRGQGPGRQGAWAVRMHIGP